MGHPRSRDIHRRRSLPCISRRRRDTRRSLPHISRRRRDTATGLPATAAGLRPASTGLSADAAGLCAASARLSAAAPVYQPPAPTPLSPPQFQALLNQIKRLAFSDEKINAVQDAVNSGHYFTCDQIVLLMRGSTFGMIRSRSARSCFRAPLIRRTSRC